MMVHLNRNILVINNFVPNAAVTLRVTSTMTGTVATGKRNFSKLKIIKSYLRSSMNYKKG